MFVGLAPGSVKDSYKCIHLYNKINGQVFLSPAEDGIFGDKKICRVSIFRIVAKRSKVRVPAKQDAEIF